MSGASSRMRLCLRQAITSHNAGEFSHLLLPSFSKHFDARSIIFHLTRRPVCMRSETIKPSSDRGRENAERGEQSPLTTPMLQAVLE